MTARYRPPAFRYPVSYSQRAARLVAALAWLMPVPVLLGAVGAWLSGGGDWLWWALIGVASGLCSLWAWGQWRGMGSGFLLWDGWAWAWQDAQPDRDDAQPVALEMVWDGQNFLLLRCRSLAVARAPRWLWLERQTAVPFWGDLRRALHFSGALPP